MGFFGELLRMAPQAYNAYQAGQTEGQRERAEAAERKEEREARQRKQMLEMALMDLQVKKASQPEKPYDPNSDPVLLRKKAEQEMGLGEKPYSPDTDPQVLRERYFRENQMGPYRPQTASSAGGLLDRSREQDMQDQRIQRAQRVVQNLADAGQSYAEAALHPEVRGVITPDEIRGVYEAQKRNIAAAGLRQENTQSTMAARESRGGDPMADAIAAMIGGEQPTAAQPAPTRLPGSAPAAFAQPPGQKPLQERVAELKEQGVSKEEARAILIREGYPVR